ncbi:mannitol dehydrogenase family protein [Planosporangium sp. 12N6]|uniref:mannitol dehydrogenase family protein n=1 Tax=Planosporangium spinosum TaxID=3402278 RepID=UPI003CF24FF3
MSAHEMSRRAGVGRAAAPVRLVHLGLGNFFRAHQAWYTEHAPDAPEWGIAAFTGRSLRLPDLLGPQDGLYTLVTRAADGDRFEVIGSLSRAYPGVDHDTWLRLLGSPDIVAVTVTVTEAGYFRGPDGGLDRDRPEVRDDVAALRRDLTAPVKTAPARLLAGIAARRRADAGPLTVVPCDNLANNGAIAARVVHDLAELVDPQLIDWMSGHVETVTTVVDRITPRTDPDDLRVVAEATGRDDHAPVAAEPFSEWVLSGSLPGGRPRWEDAGATFTDDITPYEHRKLWLLNGAHSLLAYAGSIRGHTTVAEAIGDDTCRRWVRQWWSDASPHLDQPAAGVRAYCDALVERFANPRMRHKLAQIAADGSQKLVERILPVLRQERSARRMPQGAVLVLAAWVCHLRGQGAPVHDARADEVVPRASGPLPDAVPRILATLDPALGDDDALVAAVRADVDRFQRQGVR